MIEYKKALKREEMEDNCKERKSVEDGDENIEEREKDRKA